MNLAMKILLVYGGHNHFTIRIIMLNVYKNFNTICSSKCKKLPSMPEQGSYQAFSQHLSPPQHQCLSASLSLTTQSHTSSSAFGINSLPFISEENNAMLQKQGHRERVMLCTDTGQNEIKETEALTSASHGHLRAAPLLCSW